MRGETSQIAWLAGILEGEGSFGMAKTSPCIQIQMCDRDIVERVAGLLNIKLRAPWKRKDGYQWVWGCRAFGTDAVGWMLTLYTFLGERRRAKIREVLAEWRRSSAMPRMPRGQRWPASCHPERHSVGTDHRGRRICKKCYMAQWHADKRVAMMAAALNQGGSGDSLSSQG